MDTLVIPIDTGIGAQMAAAVKACRMIFFAGLPAVGKSLFLQQQALMAAQAGRRLHLLRWDVARAAFETEALLAKYPETDGVTHPVIRKAAGLWSRQAVARWQAAFPGPDELLIGEVPIIGNRFVELAQIHDDAAEPLLAGEATVFFVPVPSNDVRQQLEAKRQASISNPQHANEARDAPMNVLRQIWRDTCTRAVDLGLVDAEVAAGAKAYDATIYSRLYQHMLQHRNCRVLSIDRLYPAAGSAYDLDVARHELMASAGDVADVMAALENSMSADEISRSVEYWYQI
ncbi:MAG: hypothetical protein HOK21_19395 [Rhodospirillaceae bacterium]|jgi:hypothetical protein|nr:hypothetical protein [Rhodospirillaceae bacterium]MBT4686497.1 hypothetical protein [Rhodospirillaceae bacterium]MBT5083820.1 hypothetical protein [Rhodospirillaceae bacterium]MBT5526257.1 hypothetical protein [Rhodospirillaceae bacterium]MBT5882387.1 hypothetical protein [Rhodospirillaceae bacterium]